MVETVIQASEGGGYLKFQGIDADRFSVEAGDAACWARTAASTYQAGSPALFFKEMSIDWRGWAGEKIWEDLDQQLRLTGTIDNIGHVSVRVEIWSANYNAKLRITLVLDAGQLDEVAFRVLDAVPLVP